MTSTEPAIASGPPPRDQELTAFRDRVSALARSAHGSGLEGAPALNPDEIDQQRDRMLAALFPLGRATTRATTPGADRGRELAELIEKWRGQAKLLTDSVRGHSRKHDPQNHIGRNEAMAAAFTQCADGLDRIRALAAPAETGGALWRDLTAPEALDRAARALSMDDGSAPDHYDTAAVGSPRRQDLLNRALLIVSAAMGVKPLDDIARLHGYFPAPSGAGDEAASGGGS